MNLLKMFLPCFFAVSILASCNNNNTNPILGEWLISSVNPSAPADSFSSANLASALFLNILSQNTKITFQEDNKYLVNAAPKGNYSLNNDRLILLSKTDTTDILIFHVLNENLTIKTLDGKVTIELLKQEKD